jgi:undecaprenyl diphosphate synthase
MERVRDAVKFCVEHGVGYLTLYAFSTENWTRPAEEVEFLMNLFEEALKKEINELAEQNVKVRFIGLKTNLRPSLIELMVESEARTAGNTALVLNLAINYGGRAEILNAAKEVARAASEGTLDGDKLDEALFSKYLFTAGQPDPDLLIKPGKETRISNFLLWQLAYSELYFSNKLWPDFKADDLMEAVQFFSKKERRFGGVKKGESV